MSKKALITGITGQDGFYLTSHLMNQGYSVYGLVRRNSQRSLGSLDNLPAIMLNDINLIYGDVTDPDAVDTAFRSVQPQEVYHLAAMTFVGASWDLAQEVVQTNTVGTLNVLNSMLRHSRGARLFAAGTSCIYGQNGFSTQSENTPLNPCSPYATSKVAASFLVKNYRESYNLFACTGIMFNHESSLRSQEFVSKKICQAVAMIKLGMTDELVLGNIDTERDWGYAPDFVRAMHLILQMNAPEDLVIATGETYSVRDFLRVAFEHVDLNYEDYVKRSENLLRPVDVQYLRGDSQLLRNKTGWRPSVDFDTMVGKLVEHELNRFKRVKLSQEETDETVEHETD